MSLLLLLRPLTAAVDPPSPPDGGYSSNPFGLLFSQSGTIDLLDEELDELLLVSAAFAAWR